MGWKPRELFSAALTVQQQKVFTNWKTVFRRKIPVDVFLLYWPFDCSGSDNAILRWPGRKLDF
jgi:hypothetical protein